MQKWEYKFITHKNGVSLNNPKGLNIKGNSVKEELFNEWGQEGWELVSVWTWGEHSHSAWKRPLPASKCAECNAEIWTDDYLCDLCRH